MKSTTNEPVLTDTEIFMIGQKTRALEAGENGYILPAVFARAIEQAVLNSPEVQAWKRDAERYQWLKKQFRVMSLDMGGNHSWILRCPLRDGRTIDAVCDKSMEQEK